MYWLTGVLGLILALAPYIFSYTNNGAALWTSILAGGITLIVSIIEGARADRERWEYWVAAVLGVVAIIAPFILGFGGYAQAMWSTVITGALIAILAGSRLFTGSEVTRTHKV